MGRQMYRPDNVWILSFDGLGRTDTAEPVTLCYSTRCTALQDLSAVISALKECYPNHEWIDGTADRQNIKKLAFSFKSARYNNIYVKAYRVKFVEGGEIFSYRSDDINQEELTAWSKGQLR